MQRAWPCAPVVDCDTVRVYLLRRTRHRPTRETPSSSADRSTSRPPSGGPGVAASSGQPDAHSPAGCSRIQQRGGIFPLRGQAVWLSYDAKLPNAMLLCEATRRASANVGISAPRRSDSFARKSSCGIGVRGDFAGGAGEGPPRGGPLDRGHRSASLLGRILGCWSLERLHGPGTAGIGRVDTGYRDLCIHLPGRSCSLGAQRRAPGPAAATPRVAAGHLRARSSPSPSKVVLACALRTIVCRSVVRRDLRIPRTGP
jgi:hypothetical protein